MKTFLGSLLLLPIIFTVVVTVVYHTSVNGSLKFEPKDSNEEYINTGRSYRPKQQGKPAKQEPTPGDVPAMQDDMVAEEAEA